MVVSTNTKKKTKRVRKKMITGPLQTWSKQTEKDSQRQLKCSEAFPDNGVVVCQIIQFVPRS